DAVLLDTAGRLMFEESGAREWREFLRLLKTHRGNCPINGMLLTIPADSLITDGAEALERKGTLIAQQLDQIQRELGVRFPVFVVVTKCDLVAGFREFFETLRDPELQHQMLGWSNPAALDEPFNPADLDEHFRVVADRLARRRLRLLMDPPDLEDAASRADKVDALYAFPASLQRLMPRLKRYLEMVFAGGAWASKPLFLRGIYFTSSMREGAALDEDLAEMVGVPVTALPAGHAWSQERSFFLRDAFVGKVFRERGLVTRAANAGRVRRLRRGVVLGFGFASALIVLACTWLGARSLQAGIGDHRDFWVGASQVNWAERPIIEPWEYGDNTVYAYRDGEAAFHEELLRRTGAEIRIPAVFRLAAQFRSDIAADRRRAQRAIVGAGVARPLVEAVRRKTYREKTPWSLPASRSLGALLRLEAQPAGADPPALDPLLEYVLKAEHYAAFSAGRDGTILQDALKAAFDAELDGAGGWSWLAGACRESRAADAHKAAEEGVKRFVAHWASVSTDGATGEDAALRTLVKELFPALNADMDALAGAERRLLDLPRDVFGAEAGTAPASADDCRKARQAWRDDRYRAVNETMGRLAADAAAIRAQLALVGEAPPAEAPGPRTKPRGLLASGEAAVRGRLGAAGVLPSQPGAAATREAPAEAGHWAGRQYARTSALLAERSLESFNDLLDAVGNRRSGLEAAQEVWLERVKADLLEAKEALAKEITDTDLGDSLAARGGAFFTAVPVSESLAATAGGLEAPWAADLAKREAWDLYEVRRTLYALADGRLSAEAPEVSLSALPGAVASIGDATAEASGRLATLWSAHQDARALAKDQDDPLAGAEPLTAFALRCAQREQVHALLAGTLGRGVDRDDVEAMVEDAAAGGEEDVFKGIDLPMCAFEGGRLAVAPAYAPQAAKAVLEGWQSLDGLVRTSDVILSQERDVLASRLEACREACRDYIDDYHGYWTEDIGDCLKPSAGTWTDYRTRLADAVPAFRQNCRNLNRLCGKVSDALNAVAPYADEQTRERFAASGAQLAAAQGNTEDRLWRDDMYEVLGNWAGLDSDAALARQRLLELTADDFVHDYLAAAREDEDPVVQCYLRNLAVEALRVLADESARDARRAWEEFCQEYYGAFPIARLAGDARQVSPEELGEAMSLLDRVSGSRARRPGSTATLAQGAQTGIRDVDDLLPRLRGLPLPPEAAALVERIRTIAGALVGPHPRQSVISVAAEGNQRDDTREFFFGYAAIGISAADQTGQPVGAIAPQAARLHSVAYGTGAGACTIQIYRHPGDKDPRHTISLDGPWAPIRLLHGGEVADGSVRHAWAPIGRDRDGKTWLVKLTVAKGDQKEERSIVLEVRLEDELPDWPTDAEMNDAAAAVRR
ncbi:MAG: hypothetical protein GX591_12865, partial [Planctomycetes bacterium]|nr:hypothetical protein [Planctomycetota bacterium]